MHGEAVAMGMICETRISYLNNLTSEKIADVIISNIQKFYPNLDIRQFPTDDIINLMKNDKKNSFGNINFSLLTSIGKCKFDCSVSVENIRSSLFYYQNLE